MNAFELMDAARKLVAADTHRAADENRGMART